MRTFFAVAVAVFAFSGHVAVQAQGASGVQRPVTQQEIDRLKRQIDADTRSSAAVRASWRPRCTRTDRRSKRAPGRTRLRTPTRRVRSSRKRLRH